MLSYQVLDRLADAYNPALAVAWLLLVVHAGILRRWRAGLARLALGVCSLLVAYGVMWLDAAVGLWPSMGLDYSTHAAVALALCVVLWVLWRRMRIAVAVSLAAYCMLMLYQRYHTPGDIASTLFALAAPMAGIAWWLAPSTGPGPWEATGGSSQPEPPRGAG